MEQGLGERKTKEITRLHVKLYGHKYYDLGTGGCILQRIVRKSLPGEMTIPNSKEARVVGVDLSQVEADELHEVIN